MRFMCVVCPNQIWHRIVISSKDAIERLLEPKPVHEQNWNGEAIEELMR